MTARRRVLVVAKAPQAGRSKTRLVPPLSPELAADLAEAMLRDTLEACRAEADEVGVLCPDGREAAALARVLGPGVAIHVQQGRGLGAALREAIRTAEGPLALVSSDVPGLPAGELTRAFDLLDGGADVVLGPGVDGGYWMIAMARFHEAPFHDIPWSTPACAGVTLRRALEAGLGAQSVATWLDIDTSADLSLAAHDAPGPLGPRSAEAIARVAAKLGIPAPPGVRLAGSELLHASPWRSVMLDRLAVGDEPEREYLYLTTPRAVFVVAVCGGDVLLVRQYRHPVRDWTLEVPAGAVADGETPRAAAERELAEETGAHGGAWVHLGSFFSSSAHLSLRSDAFLATGLTPGTAHPEPGEELSVVRMPVHEALARARRGQMAEGQSALCLLLAARHLE